MLSNTLDVHNDDEYPTITAKSAGNSYIIETRSEDGKEYRFKVISNDDSLISNYAAKN